MTRPRAPRPPRTRVEFLRRQRHAIGVTAPQLAREIGISTSLVYAVEQGTRPLTEHRREQFVRAIVAMRRRAWEGAA